MSDATRSKVSHIYGDASPEAALKEALKHADRMDVVLVLSLERVEGVGQQCGLYRSCAWTHELALLGAWMDLIVARRMAEDAGE